MGDFNYSNIDWDTLGEGGDENFIDLINDLFLTQFVSNLLEIKIF